MLSGARLCGILALSFNCREPTSLNITSRPGDTHQLEQQGTWPHTCSFLVRCLEEIGVAHGLHRKTKKLL